MALTDEEQRALAYQAAEKRREGFARFLQSKLKAPAAGMLRQLENWKPVRRS